MPINSEVMEMFIKLIHIFNNVNIVSKPHIIKVFPKYNIAIIWIDIQNSQISSIAKTLINQCFNVSSFVATIHGANMKSSVPQCKNYQKQGHIIFACYLQNAKYLKCNSPYKVEHHHYFTWCCKANFKINPPCLETKQGKLSSYSFKYINCKSDYQANLSQIRYSLAVILELNSVSEVQYKDMIIDR